MSEQARGPGTFGPGASRLAGGALTVLLADRLWTAAESGDGVHRSRREIGGARMGNVRSLCC